ncbi:MAG: ABC transporter ATP-binding protein, partial [Leptospiraceae bacterium]|nr:ABC transporter ATP-binding protein [Leptospiraceae bacterium]
AKLLKIIIDYKNYIVKRSHDSQYERIDYVLKPNNLGSFENGHWLPFAVLALFISYGGQQLFHAFHIRLAKTIGHSAVYEIRNITYQKIQKLSMSFFDKHPTGELISRITQDTADMHRLFIDFIPVTLESIFMLIGVGIFLFILNWELTLLILLPVIFTVSFYRYIFTKLENYSESIIKKRGQLIAQMADSISGIKVVKSFGQENLEIKKFDKVSQSYRNAEIELEEKESFYFPFLKFLTMSGMIIVWSIGGYQVLNSKMSIGSVVAYVGYLAMFYQPIFSLTQMTEVLTNSIAAAKRIFEIIDIESEVKEDSDSQLMSKIKGEIEFKNVTFGYQPSQPVIKQMNFKIKPNEHIGLVGKSGAGKSTIISLLYRLYDIQEGQILIDGVDIKKINYTNFHKHIAVVLQETFLFNGTIYENIAYAKPDASKEEVTEAARMASAHGFILKKAKGYDTEVGERGNQLSGGEKQRIAIARAVLKNPAILILDEATSSVDKETEEEIQQALKHLMENRTTIAITHKLSILEECNRIFVIEDGQLFDIAECAFFIDLE